MWPARCPECGETEFGSSTDNGEAVFSCGERFGCGHYWRPHTEAEVKLLRGRHVGAKVVVE